MRVYLMAMEEEAGGDLMLLLMLLLRESVCVWWMCLAESPLINVFWSADETVRRR